MSSRRKTDRVSHLGKGYDMIWRDLIRNGFPIGERPGNIPFTHSTTVSLDDPMTRRRLAQYLGFFQEFDSPVLDIGSPNPMRMEIERTMRERGTSIEIENTVDTDFNESVQAPRNNYRTILCFEVIEHVMNPLNFMRQIRDLMVPGGVMYLSTPKLALMSILSSAFHFTEYKPAQLTQLFQWAGFRVEEEVVFSVFPWWYVFKGLRPAWRVCFQRYMVFRLRNTAGPASS